MKSSYTLHPIVHDDVKKITKKLRGKTIFEVESNGDEIKITFIDGTTMKINQHVDCHEVEGYDIDIEEDV